jgi:uncharacterized ferritin-like protein (DUF455 family)
MYLIGEQSRAKWMRVDTAEILKRFFFLERSIIISQAGWLAGIASLDIKTELPYFFWQDALTANALRERVFELHYPSRLMEVSDDQPLIAVFDEVIHAPSAEAFILGLARVIKPAMLSVYQEYLSRADALADGPTLRFVKAAIVDKSEQIAVLNRFAQQMLFRNPGVAPEAEAWVSSISQALNNTGGISLEKPVRTESPLEIKGRKEYQLAELPARDDRFQLCRYYWPNIIDPDFPYGEGIQLQLRSAVSHFNEVWAVESGGAILTAFAKELPWEFIFDAARWTYDEARHTRMGYARLAAWGFEPQELPLGSYIYDSAKGQDPVIRLGMLHYFETKNIGKKTKRAQAFSSFEDKLSQHDMEFDWADETIHAHYGRRWLTELSKTQPGRVTTIEELNQKCDQLVANEVRKATEADLEIILRIANNMIQKAEREINL